jgi:DNA polymerase bacteriophage-type
MAQINLFLDFETRSRCDLKRHGLDRYSKDPSTEAIMLSWCINDAEPQVWLNHEGPFPEHLQLMIERTEVNKVAYNQEFERAIFNNVLKIKTPIAGWQDVMFMARYASIAGNLEYVGRVLELPEDEQKMATGKKLIALFSKPNKKGEFNDHNSHPAEFAQFIDYCKRDTTTERTIWRKLKAFSLPKFEEDIKTLTLEMNERGVPIDPIFLEKASAIVEVEQAKLSAEMTALTGVKNPNSPKQLLAYLQSQGYQYHSIGKKFVEKAKKEIAITGAGKRCLELRELLAKSSTAKLESLADFVGPDGYLRHTFSYYGAPRTGRWSARGPQLQNFPRGGVKADKYERALEAIRNYVDNIAPIREFGGPLDVVSSCLRSALRAPEGSRFLVSDLSAIDSRTLAWLAQCQSILSVYHAGLDLYTTFGVEFFGRPYDELRHDKDRRAIGKVCVLSCGYGLGGGEEKKNKDGDIVRTGLWKIASDAGLDMPQDECQRAVNLFREMYPEIPALWRRCENAMISAIKSGEEKQVGVLTFGCVKPNRLAWIKLPSGRRLHFVKPRLDSEERWDGSERTTITHKDNVAPNVWGDNRTYGGAIVGVVTQAVARDIFGHGLLEAKKEGFGFGALIHDEGVACTPDPRLTHEFLAQCMTRKPPYADETLPLAAESFESIYYKKG